MARRSEHTLEQIREMVLSAAESIVTRQGFEALTVRRVAMDIGYTVGSIYMVFANMNDLVMHIKARVLDALADELQACADGGSPEAQIHAMADAYLEFAHQNFNRWRTIFDVGSGEPPPWYQTKVEAVFSIVEQPFRQLMADGSADDVRMAARALWSGVHGVCVLSLTGSLGRAGVKNAGTTLSLLVDHFIRGGRTQLQSAGSLPPNRPAR